MILSPTSTKKRMKISHNVFMKSSFRLQFHSRFFVYRKLWYK